MSAGKIDPDHLLTSSEVGQLLQVNASSVKKWVNDGRIAAHRTPGGHRRIRAADLVAFLTAHRIPIPRELEQLSRRRLLVVDDDQAHLKAIERSLRRHAARLELALCDNGIDALVRVGSFHPHLVVLDVFMPDLDGLEVCRRLQANPETQDVGVIVASGHLTGEIERSAREAGARCCLSKPIDLEAVLSELGVRERGTL